MEVPQRSAPSPFDLLEPPGLAGFLRLSRPCCYIFPGGRGDSAFFAVDGFTVLVDGGSEPRPCFWKLARRLDRVDALLLTQAGGASLAGVASLLRRKVAELELEEKGAGPEGGAGTGDAHDQRLVSPEIGVVFLNAPQESPKTAQRGGEGEGGDLTVILRCLERLNITPEPLSRAPGPHAQPITLFHKFGVGRLELYVLSPAKGGREPDAARLGKGMGVSDPSKGPSDVPLSCLASVCALLVWRPADARERVVRVLFPGHAPQGRVLEGLEKLRHLDFLRSPAHPECSKGEPKRGPGGKGCRLVSADPAEKERERKKRDPPKNGRAKAAAEEDARGSREGGGRVRSRLGAGGAGPKTHGPTNQAGTETEQQNITERDPPAKLKKDLKSEVKREVRGQQSRQGGASGREVRRGPTGPTRQGGKDGMILRREAGNRGMKWKRDSKESGSSDGAAIQQHSNEQLTKEQHSNEQLTKEQHSNEQLTKEQHSNEQLTKEQHSNEQLTKEQHSNEQLTKEQHSSEQLTKEQHSNEQLTKEQHSNEQLTNKQQDGARAGQEGDEEESCSSPNAALGSPFIRAPRGGATFDLTPTEYRLLDGAYKEGSLRAGPELGPPSHSGRPTGFPKGNLATTPAPSPQEKRSSFLLLSPLRDMYPETYSCSAPTPTPTPSLPAELGSPQSTEVDESLSISLEQGLPPFCQSPNGHAPNHTPDPRQELSLPMRVPQSSRPLPPTATPCAVDLCLVSPCEYKHFKVPQSQNAPHLAGPHNHNHSDPASQEPANPQTEPGLDTPPGTEDCPSSFVAADDDDGLDSDEDFLPQRHRSPPASCSASLSVVRGGLFPGDPPPAPVKDMPPVPPTPGACMMDPETQARSAQSTAARTRKHAPAPLRVRPGGGMLSAPHILAPPNHRAPTSRPGAAGSVGGKAGAVGGAWICVDLAYVPSGPASSTVDAEFFRRVRSSYYIIGGAEPGEGVEPGEGAALRSMLDALLEGKARWPGRAQVTVIPTFDSPVIHEWYQQTREQQEQLGIVVLGSNSTVAMQDEVIPACKVEF
ncbi:hypothetical protein SKAU_G00319220 [Synaphobranchus kaupii]|uniref:Microtubule-associated protein 1A/B/S-like MBL-like domain-containing protein n=1 Tax=Synaphobranchus kaupii TaxID=118154 RepID=A0A9Q1ENF4_SYNKA|nr:hypothetical protein SKAU_G00319220 [Synaphobranchus kaupii]